jgi:S-methylmethionine-dependent homocysteine/selenocysteine methylase
MMSSRQHTIQVLARPQMAQRDVLLLDGGTSTYLEERYGSLNKSLWSSELLLHAEGAAAVSTPCLTDARGMF